MPTPDAPCCPSVSQSPLGVDDATDMASAFAALGDPVRLQIFSLIASSAAGEVCACDLVEPVDRSQPTVSHHLKVLRHAGLIAADKRGTWVWYRVDADRLDAVRALLG